MWDCFISYRRDDVTFVDSLYKHLRKEGFSPWLDYRKLVPGRKWDDQIDEAISGSKVFILVVSTNSLQKDSLQVKREWELAVKAGKRTILIIFEACGVPEQWDTVDTEIAVYSLHESFNKSEWVDFRASFESAFSQLCDVLRSPASIPKNTAPQAGFLMPPTPFWFYRFSNLNKVLLVVGIVSSVIIVALTTTADNEMIGTFLQSPNLFSLSLWETMVVATILGSGLAMGLTILILIFCVLKYVSIVTNIEVEPGSVIYSPASIKNRSFSFKTVRFTLTLLTLYSVCILIPSVPTESVR